MATAQAPIVLCDLCNTSKDVWWMCSVCEENMCDRCKNIHLTGKATRNHKVERSGNRGTEDAPELSRFTLDNMKTKSGLDNVVSVTPVTQKTAWFGRERIDTLSLYSSDGNFIKAHSFQDWISSVTVSDTGELVVTIPLAYKIDILSPNNAISTLATFNELQPRGICYTKSGFFIVSVVEAYSTKLVPESVRLVYKINRKGHILETYGYSQNNPLFTIPRRIKENLNGDIVVIDKFKDSEARVVVLDQFGKLRFTYNGGGAKGTPDVTKPFEAVDITFDTSARLIVLNKPSKEIHILDRDGRFIQYLKTGIDDQVPRSIALGLDSTLWIGYEKNNVATFKYLL